MRLESCYQLGHIASKFSFKGEVLLKLDTDYPGEYHEMESVFVRLDHELVPFFIERSRWHNGSLRVKFEGVDSELDAIGLIGKSIYRPLSELPELEEGQYYYHELISFEVVDRSFGSIGELVGVNDSSTQAIFIIDHKGKEVLLPAVDEIIDSIDKDQKRILVSAPNGLIELYLEP
jgi:16S rRNA processing protein RimM